jgi:hypothetical protein
MTNTQDIILLLEKHKMFLMEYKLCLSLQKDCYNRVINATTCFWHNHHQVRSKSKDLKA